MKSRTEGMWWGTAIEALRLLGSDPQTPGPFQVGDLESAVAGRPFCLCLDQG